MTSELEQEKKETIEALRKFKDEILREKSEVSNEIKLTRDEIEKSIQNQLPIDHDEHHVKIQRFLEHSPDAKLHGEHHGFTESVRVRLEHMIVAIFKGIGGIILISLAIGLYTWVKHQAGS